MSRASTVREPGDFALRGGIVDLWPPGSEQPLRLDFFGATLEAIRRFDAETQLVDRHRSTRSNCCPPAKRRSMPESISRFRTGYVAHVRPATGDDPLYESVSAGRKHQGMEHWLPLFHDHARHAVRLSCRDALILLVASERRSRRRRGSN